MKTAFMFSGQGSQAVGMGKELYDSFPEVRQVFNEADDALGFKISDMCFGGESLHQTEFAQPAILTLSYACFKLMERLGVTADFMFGLSLGEYSALTAANAFSFSDAVCLVNKRGKFMSEAALLVPGSMSAIMGLSPELCEKACEQASAENEQVSCANFNMPGQIVVSGELNALSRAEKLCIEYGSKKPLRLNVTGAFHSLYMKPASDKLELELKKIKINSLKKPVITNVTAREICDAEITQTLLKQLVGPVRFEESVNHLISIGVTGFVELGPGKTLSSFVKKINKELTVTNIDNLSSLDSALKVLEVCNER